MKRYLFILCTLLSCLQMAVAQRGVSSGNGRSSNNGRGGNVSNAIRGSRPGNQGNKGGNSDCHFDIPTQALATMHQSYTYAHVLGNGGPNLNQLRKFTLNWSLPDKGLWQISIETTNGQPDWWNDLKPKTTHTLDRSTPTVSFSGTGFNKLDGTYYVTKDGANLVFISKSGGFNIYFSNDSAPPVDCGGTGQEPPNDAAWAVDGNKVTVADGTLVGIGKDPQYPLDVNGSINASTYLVDGEPLSIQPSPWTVSGDLVTLPEGKKVGVGVSVPAYSLDIAGTINASEVFINGSPLDFPSLDGLGNLVIGGKVDATGFLVNGNPLTLATDQLVSDQGYNLRAGGDGLVFSGTEGTLLMVDGQGNMETTGTINSSGVLVNGEPLALNTSEISTANGFEVVAGTSNTVFNYGGQPVTTIASDGSISANGVVDASGFLINGSPLPLETSTLVSSDGQVLGVGGTGLNFNYQNAEVFGVTTEGNLTTQGVVDASGFSLNGNALDIPSLDGQGNLNISGAVDASGFLVNGSPLSLETSTLVSPDGQVLGVGGTGLNFNYQNAEVFAVTTEGNLTTQGVVDASGFSLNGNALDIPSLDGQGNLNISGAVDASGFLVNGSPLVLETDQLISEQGNNLLIGADGLIFNGSSDTIMQVDNSGNLSISGSINASEILVNGDKLQVTSDRIQSATGDMVTTGNGQIVFLSGNEPVARFDNSGSLMIDQGGSVRSPLYGFQSENPFYIGSKEEIFWDGTSFVSQPNGIAFFDNQDTILSVDGNGNLNIMGRLNASELFIDGDPVSGETGVLSSTESPVYFRLEDFGAGFFLEGGDDLPLAGFDSGGFLFADSMKAGTVNASEYLIDGVPLSLSSSDISSDEGRAVRVNDGTVTIEDESGVLVTFDSVGSIATEGVVDASGYLLNGSPLTLRSDKISSEEADTVFSIDATIDGIAFDRKVGDSTQQVMTVASNGFVGIGTTIPDEALTIKGQIHAEEIKIDLNVPVPDYVFEDDYKVKSLEETEAFIREHKHLPYMSSASEVKAKGVSLGENQMNLLRTVEELVLHQIALQKQMNELMQRNLELERELLEVKEAK